LDNDRNCFWRNPFNKRAISDPWMVQDKCIFLLMETWYQKANSEVIDENE